MNDVSQTAGRGRFEILREIGAGGAGRVYLARDRYTGADPIALKVLDRESAGAWSRKEFGAEFLALRELSHPGLVKVYERGILRDTGEPFFTSEYLSGRDFRSAARGLSPEDLVELTVQVLRALEYIHRRGYVHSDLKPGNLLVTEDGMVKLLDFGLATRPDPAKPGTRTGGTLPYAAPEALGGLPIDRRADLYSLGVVLYECLAGDVPSRGDDLLPGFRSALLSSLPEPFDGLLPRLVAREPSGRYASAARAIRSLEKLLGREIPVDTEEALKVQVAGGSFVGREVELGTFMSELREVILERGTRTRGRVLLVRGEAGIGKHRLLLEFKDRCQREGVDFFAAGRFDAEGVAYAPIEPVLRAMVARVGPGSPRVERVRPILARVLSEMEEGSRDRSGPSLAGQEERLAWLEGLIRFLKDAAQGSTGYVLAFEEVHRASLEMVELLGYVVRSLFMAGEGCPPVLLVLSSRDDVETGLQVRELLKDLHGEGLLLPVRLPRFSLTEVEEFVRVSVGIFDPPRRLVRTLHERTGGNPFFLEQLLGALIEDGTIHYSGDRWRVRRLSGGRLPESVTQASRRRVSGLSEVENTLLVLVAAYGEPAPVRLLTRMEPGAQAGVDTLLRRRILTRTEDGRCVTFRHSLVARLILDRAGPRRLRGVHARIGETLLGLDSDGERRREKVAHHLSLGADRKAALRWSLRAAGALLAQGRQDEAALFFMRALARLEREDPRRPELLESLGDAHAGAGRAEPAVDSWRKALEEAEDGRRQARLHRKLAEALERTGAYAEALVQVRQGLERIDAAEPGARIPYLRILGTIHRRRGEYTKAIQCVREGLRLARGEPTEETASLLNLLGNIYMLMGEYRKAHNLHLRSRRFSESIGFDVGRASALHNLGTLMNAWGDPDRALEHYRDSLVVNERLTNLSAVALTHNNIANIHSDRGEFGNAEHCHRRCLALRRRIGDLFGIAMSFGNIGSMHRLSGQWGLSLTYYERAIRHFLRIGNDHGAAFFRNHLADLLMEIGDLEPARKVLRDAEAVGTKLGFRGIEARSLLLRGRRERLSGDPEESRRVLERALVASEGVANRLTAASCHIDLALAHRDRGRKGHAYLAIHRAMEEARKARSEEIVIRSRFLRCSLDSATGGGKESGTEADLDGFIEFARRRGRSESILEGLIERGAFRLKRGLREEADEDVEEAVGLAEEIAASLPDELAVIYRKSAGHGKLLALRERVRTARGPAGEGEGGLEGDEQGMKPENLSRLFEINKRLNTETDLPKLLDLIMDTAVELTGAERGFLILVDGKLITFQVARNFRRKEVEEPEIKISQSIVRHVMSTGETLLTDNATEDERFSEFRSVDNLKLTSILSAPFQCRGTRLGALYLDNRARRGVFTEEDVETVEALADQAAIAIQNLQSKQELTEKLEASAHELTRVKKALDERPYKYDYREIVGRATRMKEVFLLLDKIIDTEVPVLIQGESGTGKELVARAIHYMGLRKEGPFVTVNCGAVPESLLESEFFGYVRGAFTGANSDKDGLFVQADKGTLFLDEIGDMNFDMQMKLLRVLQQGEVRPVGGNKTRKVDVRILCATNKDLRQRMQERLFREDLYYRVNVISVTLPPLRDRREDISLLVQHFLEVTAEEMGIPVKELEPSVQALLTAYSWPGNVRELENEIKKAMALSGEQILVEDLSTHIQGERSEQEPTLAPQTGTLRETMEATERSIIIRALDETGGNQTQAAKNLGISRVWLRKKMEKYGLL